MASEAGTTGEEHSGASRYALRRIGRDLLHRRQRFRQVAGFALIFALTLLGDPRASWYWPGVALVAAGALIRLWASGCVKKNRVLATAGPYALVRHPLYVGNLLVCAGFCFASSIWWSAPVALLVLLLCYPPAVRYEDQKLGKLFPGQWEEWAARTRALIPTLSKGRGPLRTEWSFRQSLVENGEPLYALIFGVCLWYLATNLGG